MQAVAQQRDQLAAGKQALDGTRARIQEAAVDADDRVGIEDVVVDLPVDGAGRDDGRTADGGHRARGDCSAGDCGRGDVG